MSSRSLAAARSRRAGENAPPVSGNRPITSTGSAAAFSNMNQAPNNVRVSRQQQPPQQQFQQPPPQFQQQQQPPRQQSATFQQVQQSQQQAQSSQPFSKLSISESGKTFFIRAAQFPKWAPISKIFLGLIPEFLKIIYFSLVYSSLSISFILDICFSYNVINAFPIIT